MKSSGCPADIEEKQKFDYTTVSKLIKVLEILENLED